MNGHKGTPSSLSSIWCRIVRNQKSFGGCRSDHARFSILKALGLEEIKVLINTLGDDESRAAYRKALRDYFAHTSIRFARIVNVDTNKIRFVS